MDNMLDKFGLYDFFGLLIPGMTFWVLLFYMDSPMIQKEQLPSSQAFRIIVFILLSYIAGTLMQEMASWFDNNCKIMKIRINTREKFLSANFLFEKAVYGFKNKIEYKI